MTTPHRFTRLVTLALAFALAAAPAARAAATPDDGAAVRTVLEGAGLLGGDAFGTPGTATALGDLRVTHHLVAGEPRLEIAWGSRDAQGRPRTAAVLVQRWVTGTLEVRTTNARGRDQVVSKIVRDSCARQVTLRRGGTPDDPAGERWHVASMSALVRTTPSGHAMLPLVDLNTHAVSGGFLSVLSDLDELAVMPQNCAVTQPDDSVRVFVGGIDSDAAVCVFAGGRTVAAVHRDGSHAEAVIALGGAPGLREIGVTVFPRRTLADANAPADTRTWVLPILVGAKRPAAQDYFTF